MSKVAVIAKIVAKPGMRDELVNAVQFGLDQVENEEGTLMYVLHADTTDENALWFYELYSAQDALHAHMTADWFKQWSPMLAPFLGGRPELTFLAPIGGKGV